MENKRYIIDNEQLMKEWNFDKNQNIDYKMITCGSNKKVWWKCIECKHEWLAQVNSRSRGTGCPICGKKKQKERQKISLLKKSGSLIDKYPYLAEEWNYTKNIGMNPSMFTPNSNKKVWWICSKGHEWEATINSRAIGRKCPKCSMEKGTSFPEQAIYYYLSLFFECENRYNYKGYEIDIFIPKQN